jgi:nitroreductase
LTRAPVVILPLAHKQAYLDRYALPDKAHTPLSKEEHWPAPYWDIDAGFGVMMILLTAVDLGLGALFFAIFEGEHALMEALGVPTGYHAIGAVALGYPTEGERTRPELASGRRPLDEVVRWERW